jgi:hypothetical protein
VRNTKVQQWLFLLLLLIPLFLPLVSHSGHGTVGEYSVA